MLRAAGALFIWAGGFERATPLFAIKATTLNVSRYGVYILQ